MSTAPANKPSILKGCLIAFGIFLVVCAVGAYYAWTGVNTLVTNTSDKLDKSMAEAEDKVRKLPADTQTLSFAALRAAFKADPTAAKAKYVGKVLSISGFVFSKDLFKDLPVKLPGDVISLQPTEKLAATVHDLLSCFYSSAQNARVASFQVKQPIKVRGTFALDAEGDMKLTPCLVNP